MGLSVQNIAVKVLKTDLEDNEVCFAVKADVTNIKKDDYDDEDVT